VSSDPEPAPYGFPQPESTPAEDPAPPTQPLHSTRPIPPAPPAPPAPTVRMPAPPAPSPWQPAERPAPSRGAYGPPTYGPQPVNQAYQYGSPGRYVQPGLLAAAADRERTMDVIKAAFTEGRLTKGEFDERTARVLAARTYGELNALVGDLPVGPGGPMLPQPYQAGYYPPLVMRRTNGFAVGALVCGIVPFFGGIPAVVLGHVARGHIKKSGERGDGMAVAGLVLGYLWISLWLMIILLGIVNH
jgi:hypothetical protein